MWNTLTAELSDLLHYRFSPQSKIKLKDSLNELIYKVNDDKNTFFVKVCEKGNIEKFQCEQENLNVLTQESLFFVPDSLLVSSSNGFAYHVIEWLPFTEGNHMQWYEFGKTLALLHKKRQQQMFGFDSDNYIGQSPQINQWHKHWDSFFSEQRIGYQLQLLAEQSCQLTDIDKFVDVVKTVLHTRHCHPALLHGDLWRGNVAFCNEKPACFDPACYYGDRETDIAMSELFGKFHQDFYQGYQDTYPLNEGYHTRKLIYNLYHQLNHANLFGEQYIEDCHIAIVKILQQHAL